MVLKVFVVLAAALVFASPLATRAQLIDSYNADSLAQGSVTSWTDLTGTENATTASSGQGAPTVSNADTAFNGHNYVSFGAGTGLATATALFTGDNPRSVATVYAVPSGDVSNVNANDVNPIAGEGNSGGQGKLFILQSRDSGTINGAIGDPYIAGYADDISSGTAPAVNQLTFAIGSFDGTTETLYWAYGLTGAIQSASITPPGGLQTTGSNFTIGYDTFGEQSLGNMDIGTVQVFNAGMNLTEATAEITGLRADYAVPEPSTYAMLGLGMAGLMFFARRKLA